jgi:hypothetical protein
MTENRRGTLGEIAKYGEMVETNAYIDWIGSAPKDLLMDSRAYLGKLGTSTVFFTIPNVDWYTVNRVMGLGIFEKANESWLDEVIRVCKEISVPRFFVPLCPGAQPGSRVIERWLEIRGFKPYNTWVKLSRDIVPFETEVECEFETRKIGKKEAGEFAGAVIAGFGYPQTFKPWLEFQVGKVGWYQYMAYSGERPVANGALFVNDRVGYLCLGSTLQTFRRKGAQEALIQRRVRDGIALGCERFFTETTEDTPLNPNPSFRNMLKAGFKLEYAKQNFVLQF